jgi:hypothetical protein
MLVPRIETLFRGQLACKLMTSSTALFHGMRIEFEDERENWNVWQKYSVFLCQRHFPHALPWDRTRVSAVRNPE